MMTRTYKRHRRGSFCFGAENGKRVMKQVARVLNLQSEGGSIAKKKPWKGIAGRGNSLRRGTEAWRVWHIAETISSPRGWSTGQFKKKFAAGLKRTLWAF